MLHDSDIREPLFEYLEDYYGKIRILEEKSMGKSRADLVMITNANIIGIEIKSDADTYARLKRQVKDYDRYYDYNIVVVGSTHALHISEHVPEYWGIITVEELDEKLDFYYLKKPQKNPKMTWVNRIRIMWRPELSKLQSHFQLPMYKQRSKDYVYLKICEKIDKKYSEEELRLYMNELLFERDYTTINEELKEFKTEQTKKRKVSMEKSLAMALVRASKTSKTGQKRRKKDRNQKKTM